MTDKATSDLWWKDGVIYCADVATWVDSDGDGVGDLAGLTRRLDYLSGLGVTTLWMMPFYPSPLGDDGYDITDYYAVDPRFGTLGDFVEMIRTADNLGIRVLVDLVLSHTSDQHPWFRQARRDRSSRYRDYYRWSDEKQEEPSEVAFPGEQKSTWTYDEVAGQWYMHRYFDFMPDLNITEPNVRDEMNKVLGFWLELGISGFRVDSLQFMIETIGTRARAKPVSYLQSMMEFMERRRGDAIFLGEANVSPEEQQRYFAIDDGDGVQMLFDFRTCAAQWLAHARGSAEPLIDALNKRPRIPEQAQFANFCRHHDELNIGMLSDSEREEVFAAFAPEHTHRLYGRGIRRRLAPMLGNDQRRIRLALALTMALPGTPILMYGDEIGRPVSARPPRRPQPDAMVTAACRRILHRRHAVPAGSRGGTLRLQRSQRARPASPARLAVLLGGPCHPRPPRVPRTRLGPMAHAQAQRPARAGHRGMLARWPRGHAAQPVCRTGDGPLAGRPD
jgi:maltose alpha-D-glucosyltransferase / alpha-amylase